MVDRNSSLPAVKAASMTGQQHLVAVRQFNDHGGNLHVLAQDRNGDCWHFDDCDNELWLRAALKQPDDCMAGAIAIGEGVDGLPRSFAIGRTGNVWMKAKKGGHWGEWLDLGHGSVTHLVTCRDRDSPHQFIIEFCCDI